MVKRRRMRGGLALPQRLRDAVRGANDVARETRLISTALRRAGYDTAAGVADSVGYGRRRKRRQRGGFLGTLGRVISLPVSTVAGASMGLLQGLNGLGGARRQRGRGGYMPMGNQVLAF